MFVPSILPYEALLAPISEEAPTGIDVRFETDDLDLIAKAAGPRWAAGSQSVTDDVWVTKEESGADWPKVISLSIQVLTKKSKDLVVAVRLTEALLVRHGIAGFREGLWLVRELLERFWDGIHPVMEDGDVEDRVQAFVFLDDQAWRIGELTIPSGLEPWEQLEADLAAATGARDEFLTLYELLNAKFGRSVPPVGQINERLNKYLEAVSDIVERVRPVVAPPADQVATDAPPDGQPARPARTRGAVMTAEPADVTDALERLLLLAVYLRKQNPQSPLPYRLARTCHWSDAGALSIVPPAQDQVPAPPTELRVQLRELEASGSWTDLHAAAEDAVASPAGRFWLDPQRSSVLAMESFGEGYREPIAAVKRELRTFLNGFRAAPQMTLSDFTPAASPETQSWLNRNVLVEGDATPQPASTSGSGSEASDAWLEAQVCARSGQTAKALEILRAEIRQAPSARQAFDWKLRLAELCMGEGLSRLALPLLEELAEEIDYFHLDKWEPIELSARAFAALHECYERERGSSAEYEGRARESFARLCRLDVGRAFRNGNA